MKPMRFEFAAKESRVKMHLPGELLAAVKAAASKAGMPYQRYIRRALEEAIGLRDRRAPTDSSGGPQEVNPG
jgi:predicted DNA binding CopG/RHH family protein